MSYCTQADIEMVLSAAQLRQLTDHNKTGSVAAAVVDAAIASAGEIIDGYASAAPMEYETPFSPVPDRVRDLAVDLAIWKLASARDTVSESVKARYESALSRLKDAAAGRYTLGPTASQPPRSGTADRARSNVVSDPDSHPRIFRISGGPLDDFLRG